MNTSSWMKMRKRSSFKRRFGYMSGYLQTFSGLRGYITNNDIKE
jgi:hypothetical protein